jgi:Predicted membrane protein
MKSKSLSATFLKAFTVVFILAQANPAFSGDEALGIQNGGAAVGSDSSAGGKVAAGPDTGGIPGAKEKIRQQVSQLLAWNAQVKAVPATMGIPNAAAIQAAFTKYDSNSESCISAQAMASNVCLEKTSPKLQETLNAVNTLLSAASAAVSDSCSKVAQAMNIAKLGLTAYTATCGGLRARCEWVCSSASAGLTELKTAVETMTPTCVPDITIDPSAAAKCSALMGQVTGIKSALLASLAPELVATNPQSIAGKSKLCTYSYADLLIGAGAGILSSINTMKSAGNCKDETDATSTTVPTDLAVKCAMDEYKATEECICYLNPRTTGCANNLEKTNASSGETLSTTDIGTTTPKATSLPGFSDKSAANVAGGSGSDSGSATAGAPMGGGSGIGGGGSSGDGLGGRGPNSAGSGLDTNILSGTGGGGGGGAWGRGGSSANSAYRSYLPGGAKDPKALNGSQKWSNEVTGQGGKSNWEKVRDRYRDNKSSLINN